MPKSATLRSVLSLFRKRILAHSTEAQTTQFERQGLLCAILLQVIAGTTFSRATAARFRRLYNLAQCLAPYAVQDQLPLPSERQFQDALQFLPLAPDAMRNIDPCIAAYLYQFFSSPDRELAKERVQSANKACDLQDAVSFTQLYTPTPVVDFLIEESLKEKNLTLADLIDPSCGAGNFLVRAFDMLLPKYVADGREHEEAVLDILQGALHGCDIDPTGLWITALVFAGRIEQYEIEDLTALNLELVDEPTGDGSLLGALFKDWPAAHVLSRRYDAVVGNPPYIGRKLLDRRLKQELKELYPDAHHDLCNAFIERGLELLKPGGRLGYITQASLLYLPSYGSFRKKLIETYQVVSVLEAGPRVFPLQTGEKVNSILLLIENSAPTTTQTKFVDLTQAPPDSLKDCLTNANAGNIYVRDQSEFLSNRANSFNYRCSPAIGAISRQSKKLQEFTEIRQGLATSDNQRFIKYWWQVPPTEIRNRWVPYMKGAGSERWHSPVETVIDWEDNGAAVKNAVAETYPYLEGKTAWVVKNERFYFREGLTFSLVNTKQLSVRELPPGCIFDVAGSALFPEEQDRLWMLAYLNSSFVAAYANVLNPTINFQVGDLKELPVVPLTAADRERLTELGRECLFLKRTLCAYSDSNIDAVEIELTVDLEETIRHHLSLLADAASYLHECEKQVDQCVFTYLKDTCILSPTELVSVEELCAAALERRKPTTAPFADEQAFARRLLRSVLYKCQTGVIDAAVLADLLQPSRKPLEKLLGMSAFDYLRYEFLSDQKRYLNNTVRRNVEVAGDKVLLLDAFSSSPELSHNRS